MQLLLLMPALLLQLLPQMLAKMRRQPSITASTTLPRRPQSTTKSTQLKKMTLLLRPLLQLLTFQPATSNSC